MDQQKEQAKPQAEQPSSEKPSSERQSSEQSSSERSSSEQQSSERAEGVKEKQTVEEKDNASDFSQEPTPEVSPLDALQKEMDELKAKYAQLNDTYLRSRAEFDNYRKRTLAEKAELIRNGGEKVLVNILPVIDDFERGLEAVAKAEDVAGVKEGMDLVYNKMQTFLKQNGVTVMETSGKVFDSDLHEAITMIPAPSEDLKGKVVDCIQKGYYLNDKVIRYAKVVVGN